MKIACVLKTRLPVALLLASCLAAAPVMAGDGHGHREAGAHEHGHGTFNMAIEGTAVQMELIAPAADIIGFEHAPKTDEQKAKLAAAKAALGRIETVVSLPKGAGCALVKADVEAPGGDTGDAKTGSDHNHGHGHDKAAANDKKDDVHSEFHVTYELTCSSPRALDALTFSYFKSFEGAQELDVTVVSGKGQKAFEVRRKTPEIRLDGLV